MGPVFRTCQNMPVHCHSHSWESRGRAVAPDIEIEIAGASVGVVVQGAAVVEVVEREGVAIDGPLVIPFIAPAVIRIYREVIIVCFPTE